MPQPTLAEIIAAWQVRKQDQPAELLASSIKTIQLLALGQPVSREHFQSQISLSDDEVATYFERLKQSGCEFDEKEQLVGNALSLTPSPHRLHVNGQTFFAWCALDTLFLPAYLQQPAEVTSVCHVTGEKIKLRVTPEKIQRVEPTTTVLSVAVPGVTPSCGLKAKTGPSGPICSTMHFFQSEKVAASWLENNPGMAIFTIEDAWQLAHAVWIEPLQQLSNRQPN